MGMRKGGRPSLFPGSGDGSTLNLDFTTGVLDSRLTFSRASTATFVNSQGYVEYAGANLILQSNNFSTYWTKNTLTVASSSGTAPDGSNSFRVTGSGADAIQQAVSNAVSHTCSIWMKSNTGANQTVRGYTTGALSDIFTVTSVWQLFTWTIPSTSAWGWFYLYFAASSDVLIWNAQANPGSTAQTYYPTTTAAYHAPRFDYSPTNIGEPRGLLIETQAVNLATNSTFSSGWLGGSNVTTAFNTLDVLDPAGTNTATKCTLANSTFCSKFESVSGLAASTTYTWSYWIRGTAGNTQRIYSVTAAADLVTQTAYTYSTSGWTRVTTTFTTTAAVTQAYIYPINRNSGVGEVLYIWGAQLELGSGASSYIPTGASGVTRNADNCSMYDTTLTGSLSWLKNATQGTFFIEATKRFSGTTFAGALFGTEATATKDFMLYQAIGNNWLSFNWGGDNITNYTALSAPFLIKAAVALSAGTPAPDADNMVSINGTNSALNTASNVALPFATNIFCIGSRAAASGSVPSQNYADSAIRRIKFFPTALTAAQLNALTTP
jgi:hypothetical protein